MSYVDQLIELGKACATQTDARRQLRAQLLDRNCLLLNCARELYDKGQGDRFQSNEIQDALVSIKQAFRFCFYTRLNLDETPLAARQYLIEAVVPNQTSAEVKRLTCKAIDIYRVCQGTGDWHEVAAAIGAPTGREPSWCSRLKKDDWRKLFRQLASERREGYDRPAGWYDPALSLAGETIAWILSGDDPRVVDLTDCVSPVSASVLFAAGGTGWVGKFSVWRVHGGGGYLYPDPLSCGYFLAAKSFAKSLRNAWFATVRKRLPLEEWFDLCWSLRVVPPGDQLPVNLDLTGRSAEAAIACALRGLVEGQPLDRRTAVTARLEEELSDNPRIAAVVGIDDKLKAEDFGTRTKAAQINDLVLYLGKDRDPAKGQDPPDEEIPFDGAIHRVDNLDDVYQRLSEWGVMTYNAKRELAEAARCDLLERCNADTASHYVESPLWIERPAQGQATLRGQADAKSLRRLSEKAREAVSAGNGKPRRVAFFADSGVGKTTFLVHCQQRIASASHGRVPILLTDLSAKPWQNEELFYTQLANRFKDYLPARYAKETDKIKHWLIRLRDEGQLVFLLDALDQTEDDPTSQIRQWLDGAGGIQNCGVYVTGRLWTESTKLFDAPTRGQPWKKLRIGLLDRPQVAEFVGEQLAGKLRDVFPELGKDDDQFPSDDDVLRVPMVLALLKNVGGDLQADTLKSRERIYQAALERPWDRHSQQGGAIDKGIQTLKDSPHKNVDLEDDIEPVCELLGVVAWEMFQSSNVRDRAEWPAYQPIEEIARKHAQDKRWEHHKIMRTLEQVGVFWLGTDSDGKRYLQWRHLSLCEYFAGRHLADLLLRDERDERLSPEQRTENLRPVLGRILDMVAARNKVVPTAGRTGGESHSPHDRWHWVFRFALSRLAYSSPEATALNRLAAQLIAHGAAFVVHDAMRYDQVRIAGNLDRLCRWLVHGDYDWRRHNRGGDRRDAWKENEPPAIDEDTLGLLLTLIDRRYRQGPQLPAAWELVRRALGADGHGDAAAQRVAKEIRDTFLQEALQALTDVERELLRQFVTSFRPCPPPGFDFAACGGHVQPAGDDSFHYQRGSPEDDEEAFDGERPQHEVSVRSFWMSPFCVTNALFELMAPSHFFDRNEISRDDDQPALYVNWFMADLFSRVWLRAAAGLLCPGEAWEYRLPSEAQWEFACRAGSNTRRWWGNEFDRNHCNAENEIGRTVGNAVTTEEYRNAFQLYHMLGNNWQWCSDWFADYEPGYGVDPEGAEGGSFRVVRGGGWGNDAGDCRSACRCGGWPGRRIRARGFRVARSPAGR